MKASSLLFSLSLLLTAPAAWALPSESGETTRPAGDATTSTTQPPVTTPPVTTPPVTTPPVTTPPVTTPPVTTPPVTTPPGKALGPSTAGLKTTDRGIPQEYELPGMPAGELMTIRTRDRKRQFEIMTDRFHVRRRDGSEKVVIVPESRNLDDITAHASVSEFLSGDKADLVAYVPGRPKTDRNKVLLTKQVSVRLATGVTPSVFARDLGALRKQRISFANDALILTYASTLEAIEAVERLQKAPGVLSAENMLAVKRIPEMIPADVQYFGWPSGPEYRPRPWTDNVVHHETRICRDTSAYQWWASNEADPLGGYFWIGSPFNGPAPENSVPALPYLGDYIAIEYNPLTPLVHGEQADLRLPVVWEMFGDFNRPISGRGRKITIIDDGLEKTPREHGDLQLALDLNPLHHYNYFTDVAKPDPLVPQTDTHGTSLAGFAGARLKVTRSRIVGVAHGCQFQSHVALQGYVDDVDWAQAFVPGSKLEDSNENNDLLDEDRSGITYAEIVLNASTINGTQDALDLYPEEWLWRRAIRFGSTRGRALDGVIYITSAGNGAEGHMNANYMEQKNSIYQIPVTAISELGRQLAYAVKGAPVVCAGVSGNDELPPIMDWPSAPPGWPPPGWPPLPVKVNAPVEHDDIPYRWRRFAQGAPTIATQDRFDFDFKGTSASAAQVAGIVALMLEANGGLQARDVKEILLRSCRVCNDVRTTHDDRVVTEFNDAIYKKDGSKLINGTQGPTLWRMSAMGVPLHYAFGAGLIDANKAVQIAKSWPNLAFNPLPPLKLDVTAEGFGTTIAKRNSETGGVYFPIANSQLIPTDGRAIEIIVPSPPNGMRIEHIEVRVRLYHKRRGDLQITLVAPGEVGWETGRPMESDLFVPHREDYTESRWDNTVVELRDPTDWTFTTVRHWGTRVPSGGGGSWKLRVRDAIDLGTNDPNVTTPPPDSPVFVPVANPTDVTSQRLDGVGITFHGTFVKSIGNDPPVVVTTGAIVQPGNVIVKVPLTVGELGSDSTGAVRFPVTSWDFFHPRDIVPYHPTQTAHEPFEYFPPAWRDPAMPPDLDPPALLELETFILGGWPNPPFTDINPPLWVAFDAPNPNNLVPPTTGSSGGMTSWPLWGPLDNDGNPTPMERSQDGTFMAVRDARNSDNQTNYIFVRLNRKLGVLEIVPFFKGRYLLNVYAENLIGRSKPREIEINVEEQNVVSSWQDIWWDEPDLSDPLIAGWDADPDADGLANGFEYKMRLNPTKYDSSGIPGYRIEEFATGNEADPIRREAVFTFNEDLLAFSGTLTAEISEELEGGWSRVNATDVGTVAALRTWEYRFPVEESRIFFRLRAELTPPPLPPPAP